MGLSEEELAFYEALETNDIAVEVLGEPTLKPIARGLVGTVRRNVAIDCTQRENIGADLRPLVKRVLRKYGYPPDKQERVTFTVLEQAELFGAEWAEQAAPAPAPASLQAPVLRLVSNPPGDGRFGTYVPVYDLAAAACRPRAWALKARASGEGARWRPGWSGT